MKVYRPVGAGGVVLYENTRPVFILDDLADLAGPDHGVVELPLHLDWTSAPRYDIDRPARLRTMYATVLREAKSEDDLRTYLSRRILVREWKLLHLPGFVREVWEAQHPELA